MDFEKFYDSQPDYESFRNDRSARDYYDAAVDWKSRMLASLIPGDLRLNSVLEVGCAFGVLLNAIADKLSISSRNGIDIASENIEKARESWPGCKFFRGTVEEFVASGAVTGDPGRLVVLSDIVEHVPDDLEFMKNAAQLGRYILLNLPLEKSFSTRNRNYGESDPSGHLRCYDRADAVDLVKKAGLKVVRDFTATAFFDNALRKAIVKKRFERIARKPLLLKVFWSVFYFVQDRLRLVSENASARVWGTNYFALIDTRLS